MAGGLSYFNEGGATPTETATETQSTQTPNVQVKPAIPKSKYVVGTPTGNVGMSAGVLEAMTELYNQKQAQQNSFLEGLKDATAWWSGGAEGPSEALSRRARDREEQAANMFQIQSQIAQFKAKQDQARQRSQQMGLTAPDTGMGVEGAAPATGAAPAATGQQAEWQRVVASLPMALQPQARNAAQNQDWDTFDKIVMEGVKTRSDYEKNIELVNRLPEGPNKDMLKRQLFDKAYGPQTAIGASGEKYEYSLPNTVPEGVLPPSERTTPTAPTAPTAQAAPAATSAPVQGSGADQAKAAGIPVISGTRTNEQQWKLYDDWVAGGRKGNPVARPGTSKHETGNALDVDTNKLTDANRQWLAQNGYTQPLPKTDPNHWERVGTKATPTAAAPTAPTERKSQQEIEREKETFKGNIESDKKAQEKFMENTDATALSMREQQNSSMEEWIKKWGANKRVVGLTNDPTLANAVIDILDKGIRTPNGEISVAGIHDAVQKLIPGTRREEVEARQELEQILGARVLDVVRRTKGSSSDKDWQAFREIAGSTKNGIDLLNKLQKYDRASINLDKKDRAMFDKIPVKQRIFSQHAGSEERKRLYEEHAEEARRIAKSQYVPKEAPKRPSNVPAGAQYSPSTNSWWLNGKKVG